MTQHRSLACSICFNVVILTCYVIVVFVRLFLQFTFDKDGKVIDATLPIVSGVERKNLLSGKHLQLNFSTTATLGQTFLAIVERWTWWQVKNVCRNLSFSWQYRLEIFC